MRFTAIIAALAFGASVFAAAIDINAEPIAGKPNLLLCLSMAV
jgi:hypothetical protein